MFLCGIRFLQQNQCGMRFFCCYAVAKNLNLNERLAVFAVLEALLFTLLSTGQTSLSINASHSCERTVIVISRFT